MTRRQLRSALCWQIVDVRTGAPVEQWQHHASELRAFEALALLPDYDRLAIDPCYRRPCVGIVCNGCGVWLDATQCWIGPPAEQIRARGTVRAGIGALHFDPLEPPPLDELGWTALAEWHFCHACTPAQCARCGRCHPLDMTCELAADAQLATTGGGQR